MIVAAIAFFGSPIGKALGIFGLVIGAFVGFRIWLATHDQAVLQGYVQQSTLEAANAKAAELQRQVIKGNEALQSLNEQIEKQQAVNAQDDAAREREISDYEAKLTAANRRCSLTGDDITAIVRNKPKPQSLGHH